MLGKIKKFIKNIGPGVITGASDDDPAGIAIYTQAGAKVGGGLLWTPPFLLPLMIAVQEMCARIGMVTGHGLIGTMKRHYPPILLWITAGSIFAANIVNIGADLSAMAAASRLLVPINIQVLALLYSALILGLLFFFSYHGLTRVLKWLTLSLFAYVLATFAVEQNWLMILKNTLVPSVSWNRETLLLVVAIFGTTISPYLFFWQASEESEDRIAEGEIDKRRNVQFVSKVELKEMRADVATGMAFSNIVMYFIIATAASTLFRAGVTEIRTAEEAAMALRPLAGDASFLLFTLGIVGTGLLAIPVLAGSAAYAVSELFGLREGFTTPFSKSKAFHAVILVSTLAGLAFTLFDIPPFRALFLTGVVYGLLAPILIIIILDIANRKSVMGSRVNGWLSNTLGVTVFLLMSIAAIGAMVL